MFFKNLILASLLSLSMISGAFAQDGEATKRFNLHTNPLLLVLGVYSLGLDVAVNRNITVGGSFTHFDFSDDSFDESIDASANSFGFRGQYFLTEALNDSWYFSGFIDFGKGDVEDTDTSEFADFKTRSIGATAGYMWMWQNFNIQLGLGVQSNTISISDSNLSAANEEDLEDLEGLSPTGDFRIGLAF